MVTRSSRQVAGRRVATVRSSRSVSKNVRGTTQRRQGTMTRSEAGRLGAEARWGKSYSRNPVAKRSNVKSSAQKRTVGSSRSRAVGSRSQSANSRGRGIFESYEPEFYRDISGRYRKIGQQGVNRSGVNGRWNFDEDEDFAFSGQGRGRSNRQETNRRGNFPVSSRSRTQGIRRNY